MKDEIDKRYDLPKNFAALVEEYSINHRVIKDKSELLRFWRRALDERQKHPELQGSIAHWTMSCTASSPLIRDNGILDEIHFTFGELEIDNTPDSGQHWSGLEKLVSEAAKV